MFCVWYAFAYITYMCVRVREIERVELLFGAHLRESLVIEGMCVCCVWYAFAHHLMCVTVREYSYRESIELFLIIVGYQ